MSIRDLAISKSDLDYESDSQTNFESADCFLQILGKDITEIPSDHYIRPIIPDNASSLGEIHFLPNGNATEDPSNRTEILHIGIRAIQEYIKQRQGNSLINYDFIYGRSDPSMASVAKAVGFTAIEDPHNAGSIIMYATPQEIADGFDQLKKNGIIDQIEKRYLTLQNNTKK